MMSVVISPATNAHGGIAPFLRKGGGVYWIRLHLERLGRRWENHPSKYKTTGSGVRILLFFYVEGAVSRGSRQ